MTLPQLCQKIRSLIDAIFARHRALEEAIEESHSKARDSVALFVEQVKPIAPLRIKYGSRRSLHFLGGQEFLWDERVGIGLKVLSADNTSFHVEPLSISEGDFPIERIAESVESQLRETLQRIENEDKRVRERTDRLEEFIELLQQWREEASQENP